MIRANDGISSLGTMITFLKVGSCSETCIQVLDRAYDHPLKAEERASMPFMGGIMQHGYQCGLLWGAALAAGARAHELFGTGPQAETAAVTAARKLVESFRARNTSINCLEITDTDWNVKIQMIMNFLRGGPISCLRMSAREAREAYDVINAVFSERPVEAPQPPVSCSALLAKKMGASDMHRVMAAGLAGGIGLSGGACGALGTSLWITAMDCLGQGADDNLWKSEVFQSRARRRIDWFLKSTDFQFECSRIAGRKFDNAADHADYLRDGGCSKLIEVLAADPSTG